MRHLFYARGTFSTCISREIPDPIGEGDRPAEKDGEVGDVIKDGDVGEGERELSRFRLLSFRSPGLFLALDGVRTNFVG